MRAVFYVIFICAVAVNGSTDAVCSVCGVVSSGALSYKAASFLAAVMNFFGLSVFAFAFPALSESMESLGGGGITEGIAVLLAVVIWSFAAWCVSVPTSESHGLISAVIGIGLAKNGAAEWGALIRIGLGALASAVLGAFFAGVVAALIKEKKMNGRIGSVVGCAVSAFFHGAQDGQKFLSIGVAFSLFEKSAGAIFSVAAIMFLGTLLGGRKIVEAVGEKMTRLDYSSAIASDLGCALALLPLTLIGIPASSTHTKTCAIAGAAAVSGERIDKKELIFIILGWVLTVPGCMVLAFFITKTVFCG